MLRCGRATELSHCVNRPAIPESLPIPGRGSSCAAYCGSGPEGAPRGSDCRASRPGKSREADVRSPAARGRRDRAAAASRPGRENTSSDGARRRCSGNRFVAVVGIADARRLLELGGDRRRWDDVARVKHGEAPDEVLELAHIAGPAIMLEHVRKLRVRAVSTAGPRPPPCAGNGVRDRARLRRARARAADASARRSGGSTDPRGTGPCWISWRRSRLVAAMIRTSVLIGVRPPTVVYSPCCSTRSRRVCASSGMSPISSRNSVPPSACSKRPTPRLVAPVKAPRSWPNNSLSTSSLGIAAMLTATKAPWRRLP